MAEVLFLGGMGRSGTTLVERLLAELPGVCGLGEVVHLWQRDIRDDERCGCGTRFSGCAFWTAVGEHAFGGWRNLDVRRVLQLRDTVERTRHIPRLAAAALPPRQRRAVEEYAGYYAAVYSAAAEVSGARVLVDSSKHGALAHCLRWSPDIDLRVVQVVRDARAVAYSWTRTVTRPESDGRAAMTRYSPGRCALIWNAQNAAIGLLSRRGVPVHRMRYEDFVAEPRAALGALGAFAGLAVTEADLGFLGPGRADLGPGHSAAGNPMRFATGRLALHRDDAWLRALPRTQRLLVGTLCAPLLHRYGYRLRRGAGDPLAPAPPQSPATRAGSPVARQQEA